MVCGDIKMSFEQVLFLKWKLKVQCTNSAKLFSEILGFQMDWDIESSAVLSKLGKKIRVYGMVESGWFVHTFSRLAQAYL